MYLQKTLGGRYYLPLVRFLQLISLLQALSVPQWQMQPLFTVSLLSQIRSIHMVGEPAPSLSPGALPS